MKKDKGLMWAFVQKLPRDKIWTQNGCAEHFGGNRSPNCADIRVKTPKIQLTQLCSCNTQKKSPKNSSRSLSFILTALFAP